MPAASAPIFYSECKTVSPSNPVDPFKAGGNGWHVYALAAIGGAYRFQMTRDIAIPNMTFIIAIPFFFEVGNLLDGGFEQIPLMYSPTVYSVGGRRKQNTMRAHSKVARPRQFGLESGLHTGRYMIERKTCDAKTVGNHRAL